VGVDQAGATVSWARSLLVVLLCGFGGVVFDAVWDGDWPHHSAQWWLIFISGVLVITVLATVAESVYLARKCDADDA
jgi:hypothetical protein